MSNRPASDFALGYLAAGSATELAGEVASIIARGGRASVSVSTGQLNALIAENRQLHVLNAALAANNVTLKNCAKELEAWSDRLAARLNKQAD